MTSTSSTVLTRIRASGAGFFHNFGIHCATHQIRVILISSVVISSLLFPAIAIYSTSTLHPTFFLSLPSLSLFDVPLTSNDISSYFVHDDLRMLWDWDGQGEGGSKRKDRDRGTLRVREDGVARARCGKEGIIRAERVLVHSLPPDDDTPAITQHTLLATLDLEDRVAGLLESRKIPCMRTTEGRCLVLSPVAFWGYDSLALKSSAQEDIFGMLHPDTNMTLPGTGITITPSMVLAGKDNQDTQLYDDENESENMHGEGDPMFIVLTYFFPDVECEGNAGHFSWLKLLEEAVGSGKSGNGKWKGDLIVRGEEARLIALEYRKTLNAPRPTPLALFTPTAYLVFLFYFTQSLRRMTLVHSRLGLAFTGIVEICVSTVTSLSVCMVVGFRVDLVPWEVFPIVVIFIGVENMFSIVDAVSKTPITLPVKLRIATGLSLAGTSNTLKLVTYNALLGVIAFISTSPVIRQFCAFAIVVLVAHWFLVHTFFVTVLSIDVQRLELDELLRVSANNAVVNGLSGKGVVGNTIALGAPGRKEPKGKLKRAMARLQGMLKGRAAKNISLVLLLAVTATLYYTAQPHTSKVPAPPTPTRNKNPFARTRSQLSKSESLPAYAPSGSPSPGGSPALHVWQTLNPLGYELLHVRVETPAIMLVGTDPTTEDGEVERERAERERQRLAELESIQPRTLLGKLWAKVARRMSWIIRIIAIPTTATTALLYGLLLYLLKDAELLETQKNRTELDSPTTDETLQAVEKDVSFNTLPRAFATDVELIAASKDGSVIATISLQNDLLLYISKTGTYIRIDTSDVLLGSSPSTPGGSSSCHLTSIAVEERGRWVCVGTGAGIVAIWGISLNRVRLLQQLNAGSVVGVSGVCFASTLASDQAGNSTPRRASGGALGTSSGEVPGTVYATYDNGAAIKWTLSGIGSNSYAVPTYIVPSRAASVVKSLLLPVQPQTDRPDEQRLLLTFILDDGTLELCDVEYPDSLLPRESILNAGNPMDLVARVHACAVELEGTQRIIVAASTQAGVVSLWDVASSSCISILDEPFGEIGNLKLLPLQTKPCTTCGEMPPESFSLAFGLGHIVVFYRAYLSVPTRRCSCPQNQPKHMLHSTSLAGLVGLGSRRSRSGSGASGGHGASSSGTHSPANVRSRISSLSSASTATATTGAETGVGMYPVSGHGIHSRRISEKRSMTFETCLPPSSEMDESEYANSPVGPQDVVLPQNINTITPGTLLTTGLQGSSLWENLIVVREGDSTFERGVWDVVDSRIVGIRRRPRIPFKDKTKGNTGRNIGVGGSGGRPKVQIRAEGTMSRGLTSGTLERWELWSFDPMEARVTASPLSALDEQSYLAEEKTHSPTSLTHPSFNQLLAASSRVDSLSGKRMPPETVPRLHFTRVSPFCTVRHLCFAGFGNTVGLVRFPSTSPILVRRRSSLGND